MLVGSFPELVYIKPRFDSEQQIRGVPWLGSSAGNSSSNPNWQSLAPYATVSAAHGQAALTGGNCRLVSFDSTSHCVSGDDFHQQSP